MEIDNDRFEKSVLTWMAAFKQTMNIPQMKRRLKELQTWDNSNGNSHEHRAKKHALIKLTIE